MAKTYLLVVACPRFPSLVGEWGHLYYSLTDSTNENPIIWFQGDKWLFCSSCLLVRFDRSPGPASKKLIKQHMERDTAGFVASNKVFGYHEQRAKE